MKQIKVNRAALFAIITFVGEFGVVLSRHCDLPIIAYIVFGAATVYGAYNFAYEGINCNTEQPEKQDKPLSDSIRQIKIKPEYPEWISMVKNEFADEADDKPSTQRNVKIVM